EYWAEAGQAATYLLNRSPVSGLHATPHELWTGDKPNVKHLRVFGCPCHVKVPKVKQKRKFAPRSRLGTFLGYATKQKGYRILMHDSGKVEISRDVEFDETSFSSLSSKVKENCDDSHSSSENEEANQPQDQRSMVGGLTATCLSDQASDSKEDVTVPGSSGLDWEKFLTNKRITRSMSTNPVTEPRTLGRASRSEDARAADANAVYEEIVEPASYREAQLGPNASIWNDAIDAELKALEENETFRLMELPKGRKAIKTRWVFKVKRNADDSVERFKARLVAKGFTQKAGIDYNETFAPVVKNTTLRLMLNLATQKNWEIAQVDVSSAFLNGKIEEELYIEILDGYAVDGSAIPTWF
ncbi:MAG: reverse transcriptase domain-containing protein, partial [bacterium]